MKMAVAADLNCSHSMRSERPGVHAPVTKREIRGSYPLSVGTSPGGSLSRWLEADDYLTWHRTTVAGRPAVYGVGGADGPPVVFLHGWALGSRAYKRAIRRLTTRGCRVFAPALPSFGGTADLPSRSMNLDGYADWVASFMSEVGIQEPALVIGHSFGGGVAIKLARNRPTLVRYLVLLNAIGGVNARYPWEWAIGFGREIWPVCDAFEVVNAMRGDLVPNLLRNPLGLARAGLLAQSVDLRAELAVLRTLEVPVLALTSDRDRLIPRSAFEAVCETVGADRRVVSGGHAWLLADPDSFERVLASTIDVQVAEHTASRAANRRSEIERLLQGSHLSKNEILSLLGSAAPLWLLSESAPALAGDLVLCRPKLQKDEIRAWLVTSRPQLWFELRSRLEIATVCSPTAPPSWPPAASRSPTRRRQHGDANGSRFIRSSLPVGGSSTALLGTRWENGCRAWAHPAHRPRQLCDRSTPSP